jgi:pimeloyl-ACP methyl ester carboxylesterase
VDPCGGDVAWQADYSTSTPRERLRAAADHNGNVPDVAPPARPAPAVLRTADRQRLHAEVWLGAKDGPLCVPGLWLVVAHGFSGSTRVPALRRVAAGLSAYGTVLTYDARGHGRSTGVTTLGDREVQDVDAAIGYARSAGASSVAALGFSMGAAAVVRHAAGVQGYALVHRPDAVVAVSGTGPWSTRATASRSMRRLHLLVETWPGRLVTRLVLRTRVDPRGWAVPPVPPAECVAAVDVPLLLVHGDRDGYLGLEHPRVLAERSGAPLWVEPGFGHAEEAIGPELVDRIGRHLVQVLTRPGPVPSSSGSPDRGRLDP